VKIVTFLVIHHTDSEGPALESLWIFPGDGRADHLERKLSGWMKIVGPIGSNKAIEISHSLRDFFKENDVDVFFEGIAD
jgi:hypothetical protein